MTKRRSTIDLAGADPPGEPAFIKQAVLSREQIGPKRHITPEGFLLCEDVPVARVGWMVYGPNETPIKTGDNGVTMIHRGEEALFSPQTIASFTGKSITNDHPRMGVTPENWSKVTVGTVHNLRRGAGEDKDVLLGDLLITDAAAIKAVQAGKREVSAGYDADYETTGAGEGRQHNIIGNHIALVERGRCGPRCAIGDQAHQPTERKATMPQQDRTGTPRRRIVLSDAIRQKVLDAGLESMEAVLDAEADAGEDDNDSHIHIHLNGATNDKANVNEDGSKGTGKVEETESTAKDPVEKRFKGIEDSLGMIMSHLKIGAKAAKTAPAADEAGPGDDDDDGEGDDADATKDTAAATADSAALETSFRATVADAEVLVPGFKVPTFDAAAKRKATMDSLCALRRRALDAVMLTTDGVALVATMNSGKTEDLATLDCAQIATLFKAAAGAKRLVNNRAAVSDASRTPAAETPVYKPLSIADINAINAKAYPRP